MGGPQRLGLPKVFLTFWVCWYGPFFDIQSQHMVVLEENSEAYFLQKNMYSSQELSPFPLLAI